jgi:outer membrane protein TolC
LGTPSAVRGSPERAVPESIATESLPVRDARQNLDVTRETLTLTRQRFDAGITDSVEVSQAQSSVASAELDYINSVFAHNVAKLSLARAAGGSAESLERFLKLQ